MVTAIVLITTENERVGEVAEAVIEIEGVTEAYSVTGPHDLVAMVRLKDFESLADVVPGRIAQVPGVARTETMVAFRTYSNYDLDRAWSMGFEE
ncbi:AsnC family [Rubrobacter radiotolerans]|uniref:AsnC family n=1 Tax=Rubrobacter radiotolerans TaxID=42256 RepID=A0A023WZS4_RUBRA|nr:Lrp/AsnC ligand binding domain-containing protein [Rubrobacter radiotolerans]AHY45314.1 AsnC family [Rubrobacter radiotolerans]MDX5892726.1 Lrp/AsnC ligand binding domain-containing protein [Rubrobacter radiotolerans]SMC02362.1 AsnC family protein [Rubrobacter radiotolerans DSM 5868]